MGSLDDPTPRSSAATRWPGRGFASLGNVDEVTSSPGGATHRLGVIAFVRAEMLPFARRRCGTADGYASQSFMNQLLIMHVGAGDRHADRHASPIGEHRTLDAEFAAIGGVFPGFFPHPAAPWSAPRPNFATASRCLAGRRTPARPVATAFRTPPDAPTLESRRGGRCPSRTRAASPSTDTRCAGHREFHTRPSAGGVADAHLYHWVCNLGATARCAPTAHRESGETLTRHIGTLAHLRAKRRETHSLTARRVPVVMRTVFG